LFINTTDEKYVRSQPPQIVEITLLGICHECTFQNQNAGQTPEIKIGNRSFENVSQFKYLGTKVTNQNLIQEEIKRRLNYGKHATIRCRTFCPLACCQKM
jgi:hypothetical protein